MGPPPPDGPEPLNSRRGPLPGCSETLELTRALSSSLLNSDGRFQSHAGRARSAYDAAERHQRARCRPVDSPLVPTPPADGRPSRSAPPTPPHRRGGVPPPPSPRFLFVYTRYSLLPSLFYCCQARAQ